jgi:two-component system response regulator YesN
MPFSIVVVDDDPQYQEFIAHILGPASETLTIAGYAATGPDGLALVRELRPDLVITDLFMPGFNGVELTRHIRRELPETKVILISSNIEEAYQAMASDSGADAFVSKSVLFESLLAAVHDVFRRRLSGGSWPAPGSRPECQPQQAEGGAS